MFSFRLIWFDLLFIVIPIVRFCNCSMFCCTFLYVPSSFEIILIGKRELVALLSLPSWCLVIVVWLFLAVPLVSLQCVIVVFPDHTHYFWVFSQLWLLMLYLFLLVVPVVAGFSLSSLFLLTFFCYSSCSFKTSLCTCPQFFCCTTELLDLTYVRFL